MTALPLTVEAERRPPHVGDGPEDCPACALRCFCSYPYGPHALHCILAHGRAADRRA